MTKPKEPWRCQKCTARGVILQRSSPRSKLCIWCAQELQKAGQVWCTAGKHGVPAAEYRPKSNRCASCQSAYNKAYRAAHYEQAIAYSRAYHAAHAEELKAACHAYYQANRETILAQKRDYYRQHGELLRERARFYRERGLSPASVAKMRARHREKHSIYEANEKLNRARRFVQMIRPDRGVA